VFELGHTSFYSDPKLAKALQGSLVSLLRLKFAVLCQRVRGEFKQKGMCRLGDLCPRCIKRSLVGFRGLIEAADLADKLQRCSFYLVLSCR